MTREEAKEILTHNWTRVDNPNYSESKLDEAFFMAIQALTEPSKVDYRTDESAKIDTEVNDFISRADAIEAVRKCKVQDIRFGNVTSNMMLVQQGEVIVALLALPSADAVQGWRIGKPTEQGKYMVTLDSFGHKHIDLFYYGKPMMPNRKVRGKCWYRSDDEWGDVVYDDKDILAWQPLPKPYKGGDDE